MQPYPPPKLNRAESISPRRLLVIKLRAIGDVLLSTVVLPDLRKAYPDATIDFLCQSPAVEVVDGNPFINGVIDFNPRRDGSLGLIRRVRGRKYDLVIDLFGNPRSAIVAACSGAATRVGYRFGWRRFCYTIIIEPRGGEVHNTQFNRDALAALGIPTSEAMPHFPLTDEARRFADGFLRGESLDGRSLIGINAGGGWYTKRWDPESFAETGKTLANEHSAIPLLFWGPGERPTAEKINGLMGGIGTLIPESSLRQMAALLQRCGLLLTNDSGPMHIAAALGVPVAAIFGPTNPRLQGPVGAPSIVIRQEDLDCLGCNLTKCPIGLPCMHKLGSEYALSAIRKFISALSQWKKKDHGND